MIVLLRIRHVLLFSFFFSICSICNSQFVSLDSLFIKARQCINDNNYKAAITAYEQCLQYAQQQKNYLKTGNAFIGIAYAYDKTGNFEYALANYFDALNAYEQAGDDKKQAGTLKNIGNTYRAIKTYDKAYNFFQQALNKFKNLKDSTGVSNVLNDIGIMYMDEQLNKEALSFFKQVTTTYHNYAVPQVIAYAHNNAAIIYSRINEYANAYDNYMSSLKLMKSINEDYGIALVMVNLSDLLNKQSNYAEALKYSTDGLSIAESIQSKQLIANAYKNMAESYKGLLQFEKSNFFLDKLIALNDTIFRNESAKSYAEMEARYQNEKKQKELVLLKQENTIKSIDLANQQRTKYFLLIILSLVLLTTVLLYRGYSLKQKLNKQLNISNKKLDEANASKTKLLSIISHDLRTPVSNLFNFLQLQKKSSANSLSASDQEKYSAQIKAAAENVLDAMEDVLIWSKSQMEKFTPSAEDVYVSELFDEIINLNTASADNKNIILIKTCAQSLVFKTDPNFLKIVLRNLVANAVKFTPDNGKIELTAAKINNTFLITVTDNGEGISPDHLHSIFEWNSIRSDSSGLGLKLAKEFTEKLNGTITVDSMLSKGTEFKLTFSC